MLVKWFCVVVKILVLRLFVSRQKSRHDLPGREVVPPPPGPLKYEYSLNSSQEQQIDLAN
jgi:hypothetical protein